MNKKFICETSSKCTCVFLSYAANNCAAQYLFTCIIGKKKKKITKIIFVLLSFYISDYSEPKKDGISGACGTSGACRVLAGKLEGKK